MPSEGLGKTVSSSCDSEYGRIAYFGSGDFRFFVEEDATLTYVKDVKDENGPVWLKMSLEKPTFIASKRL
jgi:hypothetical protein